MELFFAFLEGGGPGYLANFFRFVQTNPIWIGYMDFIGVWKFFRDFAYVVFCFFAGGQGN